MVLYPDGLDNVVPEWSVSVGLVANGVEADLAQSCELE